MECVTLTIGVAPCNKWAFRAIRELDRLNEEISPFILPLNRWWEANADRVGFPWFLLPVLRSKHISRRMFNIRTPKKFSNKHPCFTILGAAWYICAKSGLRKPSRS